jgi:hypothetical protein
MCINFWNFKRSLCFPTKCIILINTDYFRTRHFLSGLYNEHKLCGTCEDMYVYK